MNRNKILLYASVSALWLFMVIFTLTKDQVHSPGYGLYAEAEPSGRVDIESGLASVVYGPLASGDTQVVLQHGNGEVEATIPTSVEELAEPNIFPLSGKRVGVAFHAENRLDTVVMFTETEALVFENVLAIDTQLDRIACLQANKQKELDLVISSLDKQTEQRVKLHSYPASFLENPKIDSAGFKDTHFQMRTVLGTITADLPSLI